MSTTMKEIAIALGAILGLGLAFLAAASVHEATAAGWPLNDGHMFGTFVTVWALAGVAGWAVMRLALTAAARSGGGR